EIKRKPSECSGAVKDTLQSLSQIVNRLNGKFEEILKWQQEFASAMGMCNKQNATQMECRKGIQAMNLFRSSSDPTFGMCSSLPCEPHLPFAFRTPSSTRKCAKPVRFNRAEGKN